MASIMEMMDKDIATVYNERTSVPVDDLLVMMDKETWFTAEDALEAGFIDGINKVVKKPKAEAVPEIKSIAPNIQIMASEAARRLRVKYKS